MKLSLIEEIKNCKKCRLHNTVTKVVVGDGDINNADILLFGEAPGEKEDLSGVPFVGKTGKLLRKSLLNNNFPFERLYITNTTRCRPPNNRNPLFDELKQCKEWSIKIILKTNPKLIIAVGNYALKEINSILKIKNKCDYITKAMGNMYEGKYANSNILMYALPHPSYVVRSDLYGLFSKMIKDLTIEVNRL